MNDELFWRLKGNRRCEKCNSNVPKKKLFNGVCNSCSKPRCYFCNSWSRLKFVEISRLGIRTWVCAWHKRTDDIEVVLNEI